MNLSHLSRLISRTTAYLREQPSVRHGLPGVTIAITNWNHEVVLPRAIASAMQGVQQLAAHGFQAEVLVIDDASRDGSLTMLRCLEALYYEQGLKVLALPHNQGLSMARNSALSAATYNHILFLDADNEIIPKNLHLFYRSILDTEAVVVYGNILRKNYEHDAVLRLVSNESFQPYMFAASLIDACALFDRWQVLDVGGYSTDSGVSIGGEDWELYLHLISSGRKLVFVPVAFAIYYEHPRSMHFAYAAQEKNLETLRAYLDRVFDQFGIRQELSTNSFYLRYHPNIGYL